MERKDLDELIKTDLFRKPVLETCGYPDYYSNERGFLYYTDSTLSQIFEGTEWEVSIPPELKNKPHSIFFHYHTHGECGPSMGTGDIFKFFLATLLQIPQAGIQYFGIISKNRSLSSNHSHPVLVLYSYRPIIEAYYDSLVKIPEGTEIRVDLRRFIAGLDQKELLPHLLYDKVLKPSGYKFYKDLREITCLVSASDLLDSENARNFLAKNPNLEVLPLIHFND